jgi:hypothetical protein
MDDIVHELQRQRAASSHEIFKKYICKLHRASKSARSKTEQSALSFSICARGWVRCAAVRLGTISVDTAEAYWAASKWKVVSASHRRRKVDASSFLMSEEPVNQAWQGFQQELKCQEHGDDGEDFCDDAPEEQEEVRFDAQEQLEEEFSDSLEYL